MFKVNHKYTGDPCEICSKVALKTYNIQRRRSHQSGVVIFYFEQAFVWLIIG